MGVRSADALPTHSSADEGWGVGLSHLIRIIAKAIRRFRDPLCLRSLAARAHLPPPPLASGSAGGPLPPTRAALVVMCVLATHGMRVRREALHGRCASRVLRVLRGWSCGLAWLTRLAI